MDYFKEALNCLREAGSSIGEAGQSIKDTQQSLRTGRGVTIDSADQAISRARGTVNRLGLPVFIDDTELARINSYYSLGLDLEALIAPGDGGFVFTDRNGKNYTHFRTEGGIDVCVRLTEKGYLGNHALVSPDTAGSLEEFLSYERPVDASFFRAHMNAFLPFLIPAIAIAAAGVSSCRDHSYNDGAGVGPVPVPNPFDIIAQAKVDEILNKQADGSYQPEAVDFTKKTAGYTGTRMDVNDVAVREVFADELGRMLDPGEAFPQDPTQIKLALDPNTGKYVGTYIRTDTAEEVQINPYALNMANLLVNNGAEPDQNYSSTPAAAPFKMREVTPYDKVVKLLREWDKWTDGEAKSDPADRKFELLPLRYQHDNVDDNKDGVFVFQVTDTANTYTFRVKLFDETLPGGMTAQEARDYFITSIVAPSLKQTFVDNLKRGLHENYLHGQRKFDEPDTVPTPP